MSYPQKDVDKLKDAVGNFKDINNLVEVLNPILKAREEMFSIPDFSAKKLLEQNGKTIFRVQLDPEVEQLINKGMQKQSELLRN